MIADNDPEVQEHIEAEEQRQEDALNMIPSENYASKDVMEAAGSVLMNKYSEGYPHKRYYQGNAHVDKVEDIAIQRAKELFGAEHVNVQPYSGSPANQAVYLAFLEPGDTVLGLDLACGGHLTHGSPVNFSGRTYNAVTYKVDKQTHLLDMDGIRAIALKEKPKLIISGLTAYPRDIDFKRFQEIAQEVGAIHLADISHIAGLIAGGALKSPVPYTDIVTTTTHKTLRGPRGGMIMCKEVYARAIDKAVFPGLQGGPHENVIAAKAVCFGEALKPEFKAYAKQVIDNAKSLAATLVERGVTLITGGTDNHLILIDLQPLGIGLGKKAAVALERAGICCNANTVPFDPSTPFKPSGLRLGTPSLTTRGMGVEEMRKVGGWIADVIENLEDEGLHEEIAGQVKALCSKFPVYS